MAHVSLMGYPDLDAAPQALAGAQLEAALAQFERHAQGATLGRATVERHGTYGFVARAPGARGPHIDLLLMALNHGDEVAGLDVLNALCSALQDDAAVPTLSIGFLLCNVAAARRGQRFVERDLNRSFDRSDTATLEDRCARAIEPMLALARHSVDLHQTIEPSPTPFFVVGCDEPSLRFAQALAPQNPIVTYWGAGFSQAAGQGRTSDQFIQRRGGISVSVELGQKGFCPQQRELGKQLCLRALALVGALQGGAALGPLSDQLSPIYSWREVVPYPDGDVQLRPGLVNFEPVAQGQAMGRVGAQALLAPASGLLLFPKYVHAPEQARPAELYRLLRQLTLPEVTQACRDVSLIEQNERRVP